MTEQDKIEFALMKSHMSDASENTKTILRLLQGENGNKGLITRINLAERNIAILFILLLPIVGCVVKMVFF